MSRLPALQAATNCRSAPTSLLLLLPAELRNAIYGYVLDDLHGLRIETVLVDGAIRFHGCNETDLDYANLNMALLSVNRQLHTETRLIPFLQGSFVFHIKQTFQSFLESRTPDQKAAIAFLKLETSGGQLYPYEWDDYEATYLKSIAEFSGLKSIEIVEEHPPSYRLVRLFVDIYALVGQRSPEVKITVRDQDGFCGQLPEAGLAGCPSSINSEGPWRDDFMEMMELAKGLHPGKA